MEILIFALASIFSSIIFIPMTRIDNQNYKVREMMYRYSSIEEMLTSSEIPWSMKLDAWFTLFMQSLLKGRPIFASFLIGLWIYVGFGFSYTTIPQGKWIAALLGIGWGVPLAIAWRNFFKLLKR